MAGRFTLPVVQVADSNGDPGAGDTLTFYASGTSTPLDTYSDDALSVDNTNPVVADSAGRFPDIFLRDQDYKVVWKTAAGVTVNTADPVRAAEPKSTAVIPKTTTYTVTAADNGKLIEADATAGAFTITLLPAATAGDGFEISVKKVDSSSNAVTLDADGSETIDSGTDIDLPTQHDVVQVRSNGTQWRVIVQPFNSDNIPLGLEYVAGLALTINGTDSDHDLDTASGVARDDADGANMALSSATTKRLDAAWAVGTGNGGLDAGSIAADSVYYQYLIRRSDTGVVDVLFSLSASSPTLPTGYDQKRLLGSVSTDSSANVAQVWNREGLPGVAQSIATTSGTEHDFLGIPSWVREIIVSLSSVSTNGTSAPIIQVGDTDGIEASGYQGSAGDYVPTINHTTLSDGWRLLGSGNSAGFTYHAQLRLVLVNEANNTWLGSLTCARSDGAQTAGCTGTKSLTAPLDRIRLTTQGGSNTFDNGSMNIHYSG